MKTEQLKLQDREILFRGKRKNGCGWVEGDLMQHYIHHEGLTIVQGGCIYNDVYSETVGQFTGLTDRNGNKIFEGDLLMLFGDKENVGLVYYSNSLASFVCHSKDYTSPQIFNSHVLNGGSVEIVGNIYDNPELLK